mgnify:CR=1 FL=1
MRWIGQLIYDKIARFRNDVYLTSVSESAQDHVVGIDANGKLYKQDVAVGDITAVSFTGDDANTITDSDGSADFTVTGGPGITAHMSGSNTINIDGDNASTSTKGVASFSSDNFAVSSGAVTIKSGGVDLTDEVTGVLPSANMDADTAHLSGTQTFTGSKVFQSSTTFQENVFIESPDAGKPFVTIKTTANSTSGSTLQLEKDKGAAGADGDDIANITWRADNAAQELTNFSRILGEIATAADTDEAGKLSFQIAASNGSTSNLRDTIVLTGHSGEDIVDVSVGYGATSTTTVNGILNVSGASSTFDCDTVTFQSSNADDPKIVIQNNTNDNQGARLQLKKNRGAAQVNGDNIAEFGMFGEDSNQNQAQYGKILVKADEVTDGQESGDFRVQVAAHDSTLTQGLKIVGGSQSGEVDVTIGAGTASVTTVEGTLTMGSTAALDNSGNLLTNAATATNLVASTSTAVQLGSIELGHASDTTIARSAAGIATIESNIIQTKNKVIHIEQGTLSDNIGTAEHFFPAVTTSESESFTNVATPLLMPVAGKLLKVHLKTNQNHNTSSNEVTFKLYDLDDGENWNDSNKTLLGTKVISGTVKATVMVADFQDLTTTGASGTNAFQAGDLIGISLQNSQNLNITTKYVWSFVFELDFNSY